MITFCNAPKNIGQIPIKYFITIIGGKSKCLKLYDANEKMEIVLRAIKGKKISDMVDEYGVSDATQSISGKMNF